MADEYLVLISQIERLHRHLLELVKLELERLGVLDINNVQALMLFNIGDAEMSIGELTLRGCYLGSNVSYNVKKMVENGYLAQEHSLHDRRVSYVRVTEKGRKLREELTMAHQRRIDLLSEVSLSSDELQAVISVLRLLDRFWTDVAGRRR